MGTSKDSGSDNLDAFRRAVSEIDIELPEKAESNGNEVIQKILNAVANPRYTVRSLSGLVKETGLSAADIDHFFENNELFVKKVQANDGNWYYMPRIRAISMQEAAVIAQSYMAMIARQQGMGGPTGETGEIG